MTVSVGVGFGVWMATDSFLALPAAIATGVFVDSDHLLDYLDWILRGRRRYMLVLLHGWEYPLAGLIILAGVWYHPLFLAAVLGHLGHIVGDHLANPTHPLAYSILYRISHSFNHCKLVREPMPTVPESDVPLWGRIEPWLWRLIYGFRNRRR